jgi:biotin operon repressor
MTAQQLTLTPAFEATVIARVHDIFWGRDVPWPVSQQEIELLRSLLFHVGKDRAISRADLARKLNKPDRLVRSMVRSLRMDFGVAIGTNRSAGNSGYYLVSTAEEARELTQKLQQQAISILRVCRSLGGRHATAEFFGQARIELGLDADQVKEVARA